MLQKFAGPVVEPLCLGPLFVGLPVRPNMLNMPKSASGFLLNSTLKLTYRSEPVATTYRGNTDTPNLSRYA